MVKKNEWNLRTYKPTKFKIKLQRTVEHMQYYSRRGILGIICLREAAGMMWAKVNYCSVNQN